MFRARSPAASPSRQARRVPRRRFSDPAGASLLEIIVATLLMSIAVLGLIAFFAQGRVWFDHEEHKRVATLLAQEAMEKTVARPYAAVAPWTQQRVVANIRYAVNVTTLSNSPEPNVKTVRSTVTWRATPTAQRTVSLSTIVYDH
jgi:Tfp pilus assembly protein PilV